MQRALLVTVGARVARLAHARCLRSAINDRAMYTLLATVQLEVVAQTLAVRQRQLEVVDTDAVSAAVGVTGLRVDRAVASLATDAVPAG